MSMGWDNSLPVKFDRNLSLTPLRVKARDRRAGVDGPASRCFTWNNGVAGDWVSKYPLIVPRGTLRQRNKPFPGYKCLFSNAKIPENDVEQGLHIDLAGDPAQCSGRQPKVLRHQFRINLTPALVV